MECNAFLKNLNVKFKLPLWNDIQKSCDQKSLIYLFFLIKKKIFTILK